MSKTSTYFSTDMDDAAAARSISRANSYTEANGMRALYHGDGVWGAVDDRNAQGGRFQTAKDMIEAKAALGFRGALQVVLSQFLMSMLVVSLTLFLYVETLQNSGADVITSLQDRFLFVFIMVAISAGISHLWWRESTLLGYWGTLVDMCSGRFGFVNMKGIVYGAVAIACQFAGAVLGGAIVRAAYHYADRTAWDAMTGAAGPFPVDPGRYGDFPYFWGMYFALGLALFGYGLQVVKQGAYADHNMTHPLRAEAKGRAVENQTLRQSLVWAIPAVQGLLAYIGAGRGLMFMANPMLVFAMGATFPDGPTTKLRNMAYLGPLMSAAVGLVVLYVYRLFIARGTPMHTLRGGPHGLHGSENMGLSTETAPLAARATRKSARRR